MAINIEYIQSLKAQAESCASCEELQEISDSINKTINEQLAGVNKQLEALTPLLALLSAPSVDPSAIVGWITGMIDSVIKPMTLPIEQYIVQVQELTAAITEIQSLISNISLQFPSCSITAPPIPEVSP